MANGNEIIHSGKLYHADDPEILKEQFACLELQDQFNKTRPIEYEKRDSLMKEMLAEVGEGCYITPPLNANWGGKHLHLGNHIYINMGLTLVDDTHIYVGDYTMFGPNVIIATAGHPILPSLRGAEQLQYNKPVRIGQNCWIGAGAIILPGITIGDNSVIGAGSVVVKDIPENVVAVGNPCRVLREIGDRDKEFYYKNERIEEQSETKISKVCMKLVKQPTFETCGQACIAMIAERPIQEVIKDMKTNGPTSIGQLIEILDFYGIKHSEKNTRISKKNPVPYPYSILNVHTDAGYTHWALLYDGKYYDPEFGIIEGSYVHGKITSFLAIYQEND